MKVFKNGFLFTVLVFSFIVQVTFGKTIEWKLGHNANTDHIWNEAALFFAKTVEEESKGQLKIKIYPNGQLGSETDMINSVRMGTLDIVLAGETLQNWAPKAALMAVPYAFKNEEHVEKVLNSDIGTEIKEDIRKKAGLVALYYHERAPRNLTTNKEIKSINDIKGLTIRVPDVPVFIKAWEILGAKPTPMALQEVFTALQQGTIQGEENPYDLINSLGFYEVQKYAYETEHVYQWIYALVGERQLKKLSPELQRVVLDVSKKTEEFAKSKFKQFTIDSRQRLLDKGMKIIQVNKNEYQERIVPAMKNILTKEQYDLYLRIIKEGDAL